jgi:hypothetical protein
MRAQRAGIFVEAAIEAREEHRHRLEREERRVLFDVLQAGWSDSTFSAEWARLEAEDGRRTLEMLRMLSGLNSIIKAP